MPGHCQEKGNVCNNVPNVDYSPTEDTSSLSWGALKDGVKERQVAE